MFDSETRWFIHCDTCPDGDWPDEPATWWPVAVVDKDRTAKLARGDGWDIRDGLHRCPRCVRKGRGEKTS